MWFKFLPGRHETAGSIPFATNMHRGWSDFCKLKRVSVPKPLSGAAPEAVAKLESGPWWQRTSRLVDEHQGNQVLSGCSMEQRGAQLPWVQPPL